MVSPIPSASSVPSAIAEGRRVGQPRVGQPQVDGVVESLGDGTVDFDRPDDLAALGAEHERSKVATFKEPDVLLHLPEHQSGTFFRRHRHALEVSDARLVDSCSDSDFVHSGSVDNPEDVLSILDVARIQPYLGSPAFNCLDSPLRTEVNVGDQRNVDFLHDFRESLGVGAPGDG
jgi:hypothetical protein